MIMQGYKIINLGESVNTLRLAITVTDPDTGVSTSITGLVDDLEIEQRNDGEWDDYGLSPVMATWSEGERTVALKARWRRDGDELYRITQTEPMTESNVGS